MKIPIKYTAFLFFSLLIVKTISAQSSAGQNRVVDSLEKLIPTLSGEAKARALNDLGYALSSSDTKKGIIFGVRAVALAKELKDSLLLASCLNDVSLCYFYKGDFDSTVFLAEAAFKIRTAKKKWRDAGASLSKVALAYYEKGDYDKSLEKNIESLEYFKKGNSLLEAAKLQNNIGSIYERNHQLEEAKKMFAQSAEMCLKLEDYDGYTSAQSNYAVIFQKQGYIKEASEMLTKLLPVCEKYCRHEYLSEIYQALGVCERRLKHTEKGLSWYFKAKEIYDNIGTLNGMSVININIGNCYADLKNLKLAEEYLQLGLKQAEEIKSLLWQRDAYNSLYEVEKEKGNYKLANQYLLNYQVMNDSIYNEETQDKLGKLQTQYNVQQKENTILSQKNLIADKELEISQRNLSVIILVALLIVSVLISIFIFQRINIKRKQSELRFQKNIQEERSRISKDLHDNMGAELTIINSAIDVKAYSMSDARDKEELETISDQVRKASALMRDTIWTVSEEKLSMAQFGIKIKEFAERTFKHKNISVHFKNTDSENNLRPEATLHLFRIVQEVINNAAKHSDAKNFYIDSFSSDPLSITLKDDGKGFDTLEIEKGYGLDNIMSRAREIHSKINIASVKGTHTLITISIDRDSVWKARA